MRSLHIKFTHYLESSEWPICGALLFYYSSWWLSFPRACEGEWNDSPVNKRGWVAGALCKYAISRDGSHRRLHTYVSDAWTYVGGKNRERRRRRHENILSPPYIQKGHTVCLHRWQVLGLGLTMVKQCLFRPSMHVLWRFCKGTYMRFIQSKLVVG